MSDQKQGSRRKLITAVIAAFIILSGVLYAVGSNGGDGKQDKTVRLEQKQETKQQGTATEEEGEVAAAATETPVQAGTPAVASSKKPAAKTVSAPIASTPAPSIQPAAPSNSETPIVPPQEEEEETPAESCFEPGSDVVFVPAGGNSESFTLSTDDGSDVLWWSYSESLDTSDNGENVKPGFPAYVVVESEYGVMTPTSSITLHIHARDTATPGEYCPDDEAVQLGLVAVDPTTYAPLFRVPFNVTITE